jgi:hypothetical protein
MTAVEEGAPLARLLVGVTTVLCTLMVVWLSELLEARSQVAEHCVDGEERERIRELSLEGIDLALKNHVAKLFDIWMKDDREQPRRAVTGMQAGISAHLRARANALKWDPPRCS